MPALTPVLNQRRPNPLSKMDRARLVAQRPIVRQHLTYEQKIDIIDFYQKFEQHLTLEAMVPLLRAKGYLTICATTIRRCVQNEAKIRQYVASDPNRLRSKQATLVTHPEVEYVMVRWVDQKLNNNVRLQGELLREKAREICDILGIPPENRITFPRGWLQRFKHRHGLHRVRFHGERASAPVEYILAERRRLQQILAQYPRRNRFNMDETALFFRQSHATGLAKFESGGTKRDKRRLTYALCSNEDGTYKLPPLIIGHANHPRCFPQYRTVREHGYWYFHNKTAWMKAVVWVEFLAALNEAMRRENRYILLLCDNATSHKHNPADYPFVRVEYLSPNLTPWVQPMDAGIISSFKAQYRRRLARLAIRRDDEGFFNTYNIDQREAMGLATAAWNDVTPATIANCWRHTGITPPDKHDAVVEPAIYPENDVVPSSEALAMELNLPPESTRPEVYDMLADLAMNLPTEEDLELPQIVHQMHSRAF